MLGHGIAQDGSKRRTRLMYGGDASLLSLGPSRSGKGAAAIIPNLLMYSGSVICIDPKGENASITARYRRDAMRQKVVVLDPWKITGNQVAPRCRGGFNPLAGMAQASDEEKIDLAEIVTDAIVIRSSHDSHWDEEAYSLIRGLILHCLTSEPASRQNLVTVRRYMTEPEDRSGETIDFDGFLAKVMGLNPACDGMVATAATEVRMKPDNERGSVLSNAFKHMRFLDNPRIREVCGENAHTFTMAELKQTPTTVYVCLPNNQIDPMSRWFRLITNVAVGRIMEPNLGPVPVLLIADEFAALGFMKSMRRAVAEAAGYGLRLWPFVQDLNQLKDLYGDNWQTFVANSGLVQVIGVNDHWTAQQISDRMGKRTELMTSLQTGTNVDNEGRLTGTSTSRSTQAQGFPLMHPEEIMRIPALRGLVLARAEQPTVMHYTPYWEDPALAGRWDPNPLRGS